MWEYVGGWKFRSLSLRRAWIEIRETFGGADDLESLSLRRAWIEMLYHRLDFAHWYRRSPYGERGLK